jgi:SRSO17 transposase
MSDYEYIFKNKTKRFFDKATIYAQGLVIGNNRNIEKISEEMNADYYQMQNFITDSNWDGRQLINQVAREVSSLLPKQRLTGLIIDESGWVKKGNKSVGVSHQYCGNVGKLSNSQVAVFAALNNGDFSSMVDARLFLPEDWCQDQKRCHKAGIPQSERTFKTKLEIAYDIILDQSKQINFDFISADGYYGNDAHFASKINDLGYLYMLDIHKNQSIYLDPTELEVPERTSSKGPTPTKLKATSPSTNVSDYMDTLEAEQWQKLTVRNTTKGKLTGYYHFAKVYVWNKTIDRIEQRLLVIRKTFTSNNEIEIKFSFSNANFEQFTPEVVAYMQAQRFFVEHCIKESKQILGIDQFQTRKWNSWVHQVALNFLVSSFILKEKLLNNEELPLLSARDIKELIVFQLYKQLTDEQMYDKIINRHIKRQKDINAAFKRQESNLSK